MIAEDIYAAFDEVSQRTTHPRRLIANRLIELASSAGIGWFSPLRQTTIPEPGAVTSSS